MKAIDEIESALERAILMTYRSKAKGSKYPGMTYEDGLRDALDWILDNIEEDPTKE